MKLEIGSRKSKLAMWQSERVAEELRRAHPDLKIEIVTMDTLGDRRGDEPLPEIGAKGLFTAELEQALLTDEIDLAVHSLKDLPSRLPDGLCYRGSLKRAAPTDALLSTKWEGLDALPEGATIATGSQRRRAQLLHHRPDLRMKNLRGNIGTRLRKLEERGYDAIIMATAALQRLEMTDRITTELDPERFVPAVGQGAIGIEIREGRHEIIELLEPVIDGDTVRAVTAERIFMRRLEGGCSVALGAYCRRDGPDSWTFFGWASSSDGQTAIHQTSSGPDPDELARAMVDDFLAQNVRTILDS